MGKGVWSVPTFNYAVDCLQLSFRRKPSKENLRLKTGLRNTMKRWEKNRYIPYIHVQIVARYNYMYMACTHVDTCTLCSCMHAKYIHVHAHMNKEVV